MTIEELRQLIRTIPDFPAKGIQFRDITTLLAHGAGFAATIDRVAEEARAASPQAIAGIDARGFIFGAAIAARLGVGFIPVRKAGKLPMRTIGIDYALEYGTARLELDPGAIGPGERIVLVDDLIATGGTALAAAHLLRQAGAIVPIALFAIELPELGGPAALRCEGIESTALFTFEG
ncbi:adenine phosphoribosyltransferase [Altericroceibacterium xinjiangense]|uniref:adenine phosphoribosyltransferase n=1 Tax=Altericroceibacterium xinjiangense TaxID=762261 RepID=UPI000F7F2408|nr:adenine phosphoribosyltransferase [Altericroceibacterium xinjiangense]